MIVLTVKIKSFDGRKYIASGASYDSDAIYLSPHVEFCLDPWVGCCIGHDEELQIGARYQVRGFFSVDCRSGGLLLDEKFKPVLLARGKPEYRC